MPRIKKEQPQATPIQLYDYRIWISDHGDGTARIMIYLRKKNEVDALMTPWGIITNSKGVPLLVNEHNKLIQEELTDNKYLCYKFVSTGTLYGFTKRDYYQSWQKVLGHCLEQVEHDVNRRIALACPPYRKRNNKTVRELLRFRQAIVDRKLVIHHRSVKLQ